MACMTSRHRALLALAVAADFPSLRALALASGVDRHTISLVVRGLRPARADTITRLAAALGVEPAIVQRALDAGGAL
ncbi:MAG: hypothetical protein BWY17_04505 [Deltaproteobacteria bacterium ADurb.Bin207]|jgi:DNA-binding transcriptional regulator YhcF (GntR family)|nr:MAG: hypothetical protein BWY17_04505 [Deltaproteobacteria bacterium ADurb.Bin207]